MLPEALESVKVFPLRGKNNVSVTFELEPFSHFEICQELELGFGLAKQILLSMAYKCETDGNEILNWFPHQTIN